MTKVVTRQAATQRLHSGLTSRSVWDEIGISMTRILHRGHNSYHSVSFGRPLVEKGMLGKAYFQLKGHIPMAFIRFGSGSHNLAATPSIKTLVARLGSAKTHSMNLGLVIGVNGKIFYSFSPALT